MKLLTEYDFLVNDVFYRSEHVLNYLENHAPLSPLDIEAISNTILDALVYKNLINPTKESLDLSNLCICQDLLHKCYEKTPNITSIPIPIKEEMRNKSIQITGGLPISVYYAKPAGQVSFCIYDMNTALSSLFADFRFITCDYDSPTREGKRATDRPFLEVEINGELYLVDALTKRIFKSSWFQAQYNMTINFSLSNKDFDSNHKEIYAENTTPNDNYAFYLTVCLPLIESFKSKPKLEETLYETEQSKTHFPDAFAEAKKLTKEINSGNIF